jgi:4-amino-4-deoxy-L-arabinose transferase-like glycosyltransferase
MRLETWLERWGRGWRGPMLAAVVAFIAGAPGLLGLPPLDRDESRFAEASAQMLETGDFVSIHFQAQPRFKKPIGVYWLQAASVMLLSHVEDRAIWAYRVPSLAGAMLAAAACAWGAAAFLPPGASLLAGAMLGASFLLSTEAAIAATDGVLAGAVTLAMAALGRLYLSARGREAWRGPPVGLATRTLFWAGLSLSVLVKGPIGPMVVALTLAALAIWDRKVRWMAGLGWGWGLILLAAVTLPWAMAITVATDGAFWGAALGGDLAPKLVEGQEGHGAPPGFYLVLLPLLVFPAGLLLPAAATGAWRGRHAAATRFALCWLVPSWLVFEITPTKLVHYTLPLYGALAWLMAQALVSPMPRGSRIAGEALLALTGAVMTAACWLVFLQHGAAPAPWLSAVVASALMAAAAIAGVLLLRASPQAAVATSGVLALIGHGVLLGLLLPADKPLWLSSEVERRLAAAGDNPRDGVVAGPVTVAGYAEPSLVFLLGADTQLGDAADAAAAIAQGRPAVVEGRDQRAFAAALAADGVAARLIGQVAGLDYSKGRHDILRLYQPAASPAPRPASR